MQNKKSLLQRMLVIYIIFFVVLLIGLAHSLLPNFSTGYHKGSALGAEIIESIQSGTPRHIYMLGEVPLTKSETYQIKGLDSLSVRKITSTVQHIDIEVDEPAAPDMSSLSLGFRSIGGSSWIYALVMLTSLSFIAVIVLMFIIIWSVRRSIKEEHMLKPRNVWYIRLIGFLTIFGELSQDLVNWTMKCRAAELLAGSSVSVDTTFTVSYSTIIMGILIIFTAEVFAIGQNLSEEQKLTI